jgi:hypothetical protein
MKRSLLLIAMLLLVGLNNSPAMLVDLSKEDLIRQSEAIVYGKVLEAVSAWTEDHTQIYTYITFEIWEQFKGAKLAKQITIQIPGGKAGDITCAVEDAPALLLGETMILHLFTQDSGFLWVYGWNKGALEVKNDKITAYNLTLSDFRSLVTKTLDTR